MLFFLYHFLKIYIYQMILNKAIRICHKILINC